MDIIRPLTVLNSMSDLEPFDQSEWIVGTHPAADLLHWPTQLTFIVTLSPDIRPRDPVLPTTVAAHPVHILDGFDIPPNREITRLARAAIWLWWGYYRAVWRPGELLHSVRHQTSDIEFDEDMEDGGERADAMRQFPLKQMNHRALINARAFYAYHELQERFPVLLAMYHAAYTRADERPKDHPDHVFTMWTLGDFAAAVPCRYNMTAALIIFKTEYYAVERFRAKLDELAEMYRHRSHVLPPRGQ